MTATRRLSWFDGSLVATGGEEMTCETWGCVGSTVVSLVCAGLREEKRVGRALRRQMCCKHAKLTTVGKLFVFSQTDQAAGFLSHVGLSTIVLGVAGRKVSAQKAAAVDRR